MNTPEEQNQNPPMEPTSAPATHQSLTGGPVFHPQAPPTEEKATPEIVPDVAPSSGNPTAVIAGSSPPVATPQTAISNDSQTPARMNTNITQNVQSKPENKTVKVADNTPQNDPKPVLSAPPNTQPATSPAGPSQNTKSPDNKPMHPSSKSSFAIALIVAAFLVILGIGGLIFFTSKNAGQSSQWFGNSQKKQADQNLSDSGAGQITNLPDGYQLVSRSCFQLGVPQNSTVSAERGCLLLVASPIPQYLNFSVTPSTEKNAGLSALGTAVEKNYNSSLLKLVSKSDATIGGSSAKKLEFTAANGVNQVKLLVIPPKPSYLQDNTPITSFEISYSYKSDEEKARAESVLGTWNWK